MPCKYYLELVSSTSLGNLSFVTTDAVAGSCAAQNAMQWRRGEEHFETFFFFKDDDG